jgi:formylglycine-generating enzyme
VLSDSPSGTFDQGGNVWEWSDEVKASRGRGMRGGAWHLHASPFLAAYHSGYDYPTFEHEVVGFRVASVVPEPGTGLLVMAGLLGLAGWRRRNR